MSENKHTPEVRKLGDRFYVDHGTHEMVYGADGTYLGQYQDDVMDNGQIFIGRNPSKPVKPLTPAQVSAAISKATGDQP